MITNTHETKAVHLVALGSCELVIVAVGGAGDGGDSSSNSCGGGGSGYVVWKAQNMTGTMELEVSVGGEGSKSSVRSNGTIIVEADRGESGDDGDSSGHPSSGGDGYCGGGGGGSDHAGKGGENGKDGEYGSGSYAGSGGSGSALDVSAIPIKTSYERISNLFFSQS